MAKSIGSAALRVVLNGREVGCYWRKSTGAVGFDYVKSWLDWERSFPVSLSMPLRQEGYTGSVVTAVFENLLPDDQKVREKVAAKSDASTSEPFHLLEAIGRDCVGALQFLPEGESLSPVGALDSRLASPGEIAGMLANLTNMPLGIGDDQEFRISLAGAQEKLALLKRDGQWHIPHGATPTTHILKPQTKAAGQIDLRDSVENEHYCMTVLKNLGMEVAATEIETFCEHEVLVVERFDRLWTSDGRLIRLPQEDFCQALSVPPAKKYQSDGGPSYTQIMELLKASDDAATDRLAFTKAQIVFWLLAAIDGHAKNFSIRLLPSGFRLAPLYDVISAQPVYDNGQLTRKKMKLGMSVGDSSHYTVHDIMPRHFLQSAKQVGLPSGDVEDIFAELVEQMQDALNQAIEDMPADFPRQLAESVRDGALKRLRRIEQAMAVSG